MKAVSILLILFLILDFLANCDKNSTGTDQPLASNISGIWRGDYFAVSKSDGGTFIVEIIQNGNSFSGEAVLRSSIRNERLHLFIKGTVSKDELSVELNNDKIPYQYEFTN